MYDKLNKAVYVKSEGKIKDIEKQYESINLFNSVKDEFEAIAGIVENTGTWVEVE